MEEITSWIHHRNSDRRSHIKNLDIKQILDVLGHDIVFYKELIFKSQCRDELCMYVIIYVFLSIQLDLSL